MANLTLTKKPQLTLTPKAKPTITMPMARDARTVMGQGNTFLPLVPTEIEKPKFTLPEPTYKAVRSSISENNAAGGFAKADSPISALTGPSILPSVKMEQAVAEKQASDSAKELARLLSYDVSASEKEIAALKLDRNAEKMQNIHAAGSGTKGTFQISAFPTADASTGAQDRIDSLQRETAKAKSTQSQMRYSALPSSSDFAKYAAEGAAIKNPSVQDAERGVSIAGWKPFAENVGNIVTYSRDNYGKLTDVNDVKYHYMTDEEVDIYNYLLAKEGRNSAQEYLDYLEEPLNSRLGAVQAKGIQDIKNTVGRTLATGWYGSMAGLDQNASGLRQLASEERQPTSTTQFGSAYVREGLKDTGPKVLGRSLGQIGYDLVNTGANMAPAILLGAATGGAGLPAAISGGIGAAAVALPAAGNAYNQALGEGYGSDEARNYAALVGASEGALQYLLGGIGALGGKVTGNVAKSTLQNIDNALLRVAVTLGIKMAGEGTEEYLQEILEPVFRNLAFNENNEFKPVTEDALYSALLGALTAGVAEVGGVVRAETAPSQASVANSAIDSAYSTMAERGMFAPESTGAVQNANRVLGLPTWAETSGSRVSMMPGATRESTSTTQTVPTVGTEVDASTTVNAAVDNNTNVQRVFNTIPTTEPQQVTPPQSGGDSVGAAKSAYEYQQKDSRVGSNTFSKMYADVLGEMESAGADLSVLPYDVVTERQSVDRAQQRLFADLEGEISDLPKRPAWSGEDLDTAMGVLDRYLNEAKESGDYSKSNEWAKLIREKGTQAGQMIQAFAKYSRTPDGVLVQAVDTLEKAGVSPETRNKVMTAMNGFSETLSTVESGDNAALVNLIKQQAEQRGTKVSKVTERALLSQDFQYLYDFAMRQLGEIAEDYNKASAGKKISTYQAFSHLFNLRTANRNLASNQIFDIVDTAANDVAMIPDAIIGLATGQRTVGLEKSWFSGEKRSGAMKGAGRAWAEVALDVDMGGQSKYGTGGRRTFKMTGGLPSKVMSTMEKAMGFELNITDEFHKGSVEAEVLESLAPFVEKGDITAKEAAEWAKHEALYRSFQDETWPGMLLGKMKGLLNTVPSFGPDGKIIFQQADFGLGDLIQKYTQVPGALMSRAVEYSPLGYGKAISALARLAQSGGNNTTAQRQAALAIGRSTTGTGLVALFAALAAGGVLSRADDEDDRDVAAQNAAEGISGTQLNWSGLGRWLSDGDPTHRDGDVLVSLDFLEPLNALMTIGALVASDDSERGFAGKALGNSFEGTFQAILDTPTMQTFSTVFDTMRYHKDDDETPLWLEVPVEIAKGSVTGFVPGLVRQTAQATDPVYRDTYTSDNPLQQTIDSTKNAIPGLRQTLPVKVTPFGENKTYGGGPALQAANTFLMPGALGVYQPAAVSDELNRVRNETGANNIYPDRNAPKTVKYGGETYELSVADRETYQRRRGTLTNELMTALIGSKLYKGANVDEQAAILSDAVQFANDTTKREILDEKGVSYKSSQWEKAYQAVEAGVGFDLYLEYKDRLTALKEQGKTSDANAAVRNELMKDSRLTKAQRSVLDETLLSDTIIIPNEVKVDYWNDDSFIITQMSASAQKKWPNIRDSFGLTAETYREAYQTYTNDSLTADEKKKKLQEIVGGYAEGNRLYKALGKKDK